MYTPHTTTLTYQGPSAWGSSCLVPTKVTLRVKPLAPPLPAGAKMKARYLGREIGTLYSALAYFNWKHGVPMNAHVVIVWDKLGITDQRQAAGLLPLLNQRIGRWLRRVLGVEYSYVYVHEIGQKKGFHTHLLTYIPPAHLGKLKGEFVRRLADLTGVEDDAAVWHKPENLKNEASALYRQWNWFRYICKGVEPCLQVLNKYDKSRELVQKVFQLSRRPPAGEFYIEKRAGVSINLGLSAQNAAGFVSRFDRGHNDKLYDGGELAEYTVRTFAAMLD